MVGKLVTDLKYLPDGGPYSQTLSGLVPGQRYWVLIYALNARGYGEGQGPTPLYEFPRSLPRSPTNVRAEITSATMITVAFDLPLDNGGDNVTDFVIEWDIDPYFESLALPPFRGSATVAAAASRFFTITDLSPDQVMYVRVSAKNRVGQGLPTNPRPEGIQTMLRRPGRPNSIVLASNASNPSVQCGGEILVSLQAPIVPDHGLFCSGGGLAAPSAPGSCPSLGMGYGAQADGGSAIEEYIVQWSAQPDFSASTTDGGTF